MWISSERPNVALTQFKSGEDLARLVRMMKLVAHANLYFGTITVLFYLMMREADAAVLTVGMLSVCTYVLVKMKISFIHGSKSWIEISVTSACGLYLPFFMLAVTMATFTKAMMG